MLTRRDLFDARFQLLALDEPDERAVAFVDAPADLVPGAYEGGLKTWECALDLAAYLDRDVLGSQSAAEAAGAGDTAAAGRRIRGSRVLEVSSCWIPVVAQLTGERSYVLVSAPAPTRLCLCTLLLLSLGVKLGCGTAVPTLLLLDRLFAHVASEPVGVTDPPCGADDSDVGSTTSPSSVRATEIHLQDYNRSVLELVTFPNVLLAWCASSVFTSRRPLSFMISLTNVINKIIPTDMSPLSAEYRASSATDSDDDDGDRGVATTRGDVAHTAPAYPRGPGGLTVTGALLDAFRASLDAHRVRLRFFAGGWSTLPECLAHQGGSPSLPYDIVLASETIYRTEALGAFLGVLRTTTATAAAITTTTASPTAASAPPCDIGEARNAPLCLIAAKVLYFGVGGGVQAFVSAVEGEHGTVRTVWEHREGVGREIMRIEWE